MTPANAPNKMSNAEHQLLNAELGGEAVRLMLRTQTRVDTGRWLRSSRLWLCVTEDRLILFAVSKRRYCEAVDLSECVDSLYSHPTGQLVIAPTEQLRFSRVRLSPTDALHVLRLIEQRNTEKRTIPTSSTTETTRA